MYSFGASLLFLSGAMFFQVKGPLCFLPRLQQVNLKKLVAKAQAAIFEVEVVLLPP